MAMPEEIQSVANSFLELAPGVSANPGNLKMLLRWILEKERGVGWENASDEMAVIIYERGTKKKPELHAVLYGPLTNVTPAGSNIMTRDLIADTKSPATEDGLLETIVFLKRSIHKYRTEGTCFICPPEKKRLKAEGMTSCEYCMLKLAIGI